MTKKDFLLGDRVASALDLVGITKERVANWIGGPCGCEERQLKLNAMSVWTSRVLRGLSRRPELELEKIMEG